VSLTSTLYSYL